MTLTKEQILAATDRTRKLVHVPEWNGDVYVSAMTGTDLNAFQAECMVDGRVRLEAFYARLLSKTLTSAEGVRLFTDEEVAALGAKAGGVLKRLADVASELNGLTAEDVSELAKNSVSARSDVSGSASL